MKFRLHFFTITLILAGLAEDASAGPLKLQTTSGRALASQCYDLRKSEPHTLTGTLDYVIFPGPPEFEDVQKGDAPEPSYVLRLAMPICLTGDSDSNADPNRKFSAVQVVVTSKTQNQAKGLLHRKVTLTLTDQMAAITGHHHEPLVAWLVAVHPAAKQPMDFTVEYGTAATTIRAFYDALGDGKGSIASGFIVPEKRKMTNFSATKLSSFYGKLKNRIQLIDITENGADTYLVHYRYSTSLKSCDGKASVTTVIRDSKYFIQSIVPLNRC